MSLLKRKKNHESYIYLKPTLRFKSIEIIIAYENEPRHNNERLVVYSSGHPEFVNDQIFQNILDFNLKMYKYIYSPDITNYSHEMFNDWQFLNDMKKRIDNYYDSNKEYPAELGVLYADDYIKNDVANKYIYLCPKNTCSESYDQLLVYNKDLIDGKGRHVLYLRFSRRVFSKSPYYVLYLLEAEFRGELERTEKGTKSAFFSIYDQLN